MGIIRTENLGFRYKNNPVLEQINLNIPAGSLYGYLGKNGAGKSTTIKLLLGLLNPGEGAVFYKGKELSGHRTEIMTYTGNLIESPCFYPNLTAYENLKYLDVIFNCGNKRIVEVLDFVGLSGSTDKKVKRFSSGMKQRLGIAIAILHQPDILILDEPVNGLDPEGIHDVRELLLKLHTEGKTIFLSSHLLSEIEKICTHIGILHQKRLVFQDTKEQLMSNVRKEILIRVSDLQKTYTLCAAKLLETRQVDNSTIGVKIPGEEIYNGLLHLLISNKIDIYSIELLSPNLESVFLSVINQPEK
jgi:ABC-2 type transport system ATP-binding protein